MFRDNGNLLRKVQGAKLPAWDRKVTVEGLPERPMKYYGRKRPVSDPGQVFFCPRPYGASPSFVPLFPDWEGGKKHETPQSPLGFLNVGADVR